MDKLLLLNLNAKLKIKIGNCDNNPSNTAHVSPYKQIN